MKKVKKKNKKALRKLLRELSKNPQIIKRMGIYIYPSELLQGADTKKK